MAYIRRAVLLALFIFVVFVVLYPNPFGNNPDVIEDESYFLTSSLSAIQKVTLPGWEFSHSGNYYGGVQTYVDTAVLVPVLTGVFVHEHFSATATELWVALNTGQLLHVLRVVNGVAALLALAWCYYYFSKRKIPEALGWVLTLWLMLILSDVIVIELLHTAKVWGFYTLIVAVVSAFFIAQEYYLSQKGEPFLPVRTYTALLVWGAVVMFFQNYFGMFSILLLMLYALFLRHVTVRDIWQYVWQRWYWFVLFALTQVSFLWRAVFINGYGAFSDLSIKTQGNHIEWAGRLWAPLVYTVTSHPLAVALYGVGLVWAALLLLTKERSYFADWRRKRYLAVAAVHPVLVYGIFHVGIGFSVATRYGILLTLACAFSATLFMAAMGKRSVYTALVLSSLLFLVLGVHSIELYWHPSSEVLLLNTIEARYDSPNTAFIEGPTVIRMTLPVNEASLALLDPKRESFSRFQFMLAHPALVGESVAFKPLTVLTYTPEEEATAQARLSVGTTSVWAINNCAELCTAAAEAAGTCFEVHIDSCDLSPQEVNDLPQFLSATELGNAYVVTRVH